MSTAYRSNRKASDADIVRLNSLGLSLATIGQELGCHPTTVTLRLKALGVEPADTRRAFMEDILRGTPLPLIDWIQSKLGPNQNIKQFVKGLITEAYIRDKSPP